MKRKPLDQPQKDRAKRLRAIWDRRLSEWRARGDRLTQALAADRFGWSEQSAVSQYLNARVPLNMEAGIKFASLLKVPLAEIEPDWQPAAQTRDDYAQVRYYPEVAASAGNGFLPAEEADVTLMDIAKSLLERRGVKPRDAALLQVDGESMSGTLEHGDIILVDTSDNEPRDSRVYVVELEGAVMVKRVQHIPRGIKLLSDNPIYDSVTIMANDQDVAVRIVGRVLMTWHARNLID